VCGAIRVPSIAGQPCDSLLTSHGRLLDMYRDVQGVVCGQGAVIIERRSTGPSRGHGAVSIMSSGNSYRLASCLQSLKSPPRAPMVGQTELSMWIFLHPGKVPQMPGRREGGNPSHPLRRASYVALADKSPRVRARRLVEATEFPRYSTMVRSVCLAC
jgi:hypothetical protein